MEFIQDDFLLHSEIARQLYHNYAAPEPILDYHSHLSPADIATDRRFGDLFEIWLEGDHYKWRVMRANGVDERYCTGNAAPYEKFLARACTVPATLRNLLYHWTHLELQRYFGVRELRDERRRTFAIARTPCSPRPNCPCAWWFLDHKKAMQWQLNALSSTGLLSRFVGVLTDARSFMSFPRHEYFRRFVRPAGPRRGAQRASQ